MWAAMENHADAVTLLVSRGARPDDRSTVTSFPRLRFGDGIVARQTVLPRGGWTPLMYAARQNAIDAARALADAGANLNLTDPDGTSALVFAIINGHFDLAQLLLEKGADPNVADEKGMAALYAAVDMHTLDETVGRPNPKPHGRLDAAGLVGVEVSRLVVLELSVAPSAAADVVRPISAAHSARAIQLVAPDKTPGLRV